ncbi:MAG: sodium-dependent transporter [Candidatus Aminicenantes bacterium]|nr:sodium-dependent transporter [Candidatus Aminicenantes bacterium]
MTRTGRSSKRETFSSIYGLVTTMIGVAVGLGAVWRFPYMAGRFGGSAFVLFYMFVIFFVGIPALMCEWMLGRHTGRGTLGAFEKGGIPGGKIIGVFLFGIVLVASGYYSNALGWVGFHVIAEASNAFGINIDGQSILPPHQGINLLSLILQTMMTLIVILSCAVVLKKGLNKGIERISRWVVPMMFTVLIVLIFRALSLKGAMRGVMWYIGSFEFSALTPSVMAAALGMAFFSMSLGGTFMVIYGSYMNSEDAIPKNAILTGLGASTAGILAGFAIFPAVFAFGLEPSSGPDLIFVTLPKTFAMMPMGWLFGLLFFLGLFGAAFLSDVAAFEVLIGGLVDNTGLDRKKAVGWVCFIVFFLALPPMINFKVFIPWDLIFGSGMQAVGSLMAVITSVWFIRRSDSLKELSRGMRRPFPLFLYWWMRVAIPIAIVIVGANWIREALS